MRKMNEPAAYSQLMGIGCRCLLMLL